MKARRYNPVDVRLVGLRHTALLTTLQGQCFTTSWSEATITELLTQTEGFGLIAVENDEAATPLGFSLAHATLGEAEIYAIGVLASARRRGIGRQLLAATNEQAARLGARVLFLEVAESNHAGRSLYSAAGFRQVGRRPNYYRYPDGKAEAALIMRRDLVV
jgi:ribosomal-protein-alanine N-acetyltransferase